MLRVLCFFFFKQKTAYEMSLRDWSSDVCSSDLSSVGATCAVPLLRRLIPVFAPHCYKHSAPLGAEPGEALPCRTLLAGSLTSLAHGLHTSRKQFYRAGFFIAPSESRLPEFV